MISLRDQLAAALAACEPTPEEVRHLGAMWDLAGSPGDVFSSSWFEPGHFTVSGFITDPGISAVVLIHHRRLDRWLQPGGHIEAADGGLASALMREMREETGLIDLTPEEPRLFDVDVHTVPPHGPAPAHRHYDLRFHLATETAELEASPDVDGAAWVALDDVERWTDDQSVLRTVAKLAELRERLLRERSPNACTP